MKSNLEKSREIFFNLIKKSKDMTDRFYDRCKELLSKIDTTGYYYITTKQAIEDSDEPMNKNIIDMLAITHDSWEENPAKQKDALVQQVAVIYKVCFDENIILDPNSTLRNTLEVDLVEIAGKDLAEQVYRLF